MAHRPKTKAKVLQSENSVSSVDLRGKVQVVKESSKKNKKLEMRRELTWQGALKKLRNRIFKIRSPRGHGTGFHIGNFGSGNKLCAIATAFHVVEEAVDWGGPIKVVHAETGKELLLKGGDRAIFPYPKSDLAIIVFNPPLDLVLTSDKLEHLISTHHLVEGVDIAWCGFPGLRSDKLCFFHGYISSYLNQEEGYLVDGVAINGVSGGPVFFIDKEKNLPIIAGVITAYIANRATKDTLPGVSMVAPVSPYENTIKFLNNLSEATKEANEQVKEQKLENIDKKPENELG